MTYNPVPAKRRKLWPWIVGIGLFVLLGCGLVTIVGIGGTAAVIEKEAESRNADIKLKSCSKTIINTVEVSYTITNSSSIGRTYLPEFRIVAHDGVILGSANDFTPEVPAGSTYKGKAIGSIAEGAGKFSCELVNS